MFFSLSATCALDCHCVSHTQNYRYCCFVWKLRHLKWHLFWFRNTYMWSS